MSNSSSSGVKRRKLATGHRVIDAALLGGLEYGSISCITAAADSAVTEVTQSLLIAHLLESSANAAAYIDATQALDVRRLHQGLSTALRLRDNGHDFAQQSVAALDRVTIMKVFDFVGLTESLAELRDTLEGRPPTHLTAEAQLPEAKDTLAPRGTVGDSEDEEDDDDLLSNQSRPATKPQQQQHAHPQLRPSLLIIDNMTQLAAPQLKSDSTQGSALLAALMRSLAHLTRAFDLCTVVLNSGSLRPTARLASPSIFQSCLLVPPLGSAFTHSLDMHLLIHRLPRLPADARALYGRSEHGGTVGMADVVEVVQDRHGGRVGRWAPFRVEADGRLASASS